MIYYYYCCTAYLYCNSHLYWLVFTNIHILNSHEYFMKTTNVNVSAINIYEAYSRSLTLPSRGIIQINKVFCLYERYLLSSDSLSSIIAELFFQMCPYVNAVYVCFAYIVYLRWECSQAENCAKWNMAAQRKCFGLESFPLERCLDWSSSSLTDTIWVIIHRLRATPNSWQVTGFICLFCWKYCENLDFLDQGVYTRMNDELWMLTWRLL